MAEKKAVAKKAAPKAQEVLEEVQIEKKKWVRKTRIYKLLGQNANSPFVRLQAEDRPGRGNKRLLYFDEESGRQRAIRYIVNYDSPFIDDQDSSGWDLAPEHIVFQRGHLIVDQDKIALQKFLDVHPWNEKNGGKGPVRFFEYDPEAEAKEEVENLMLEAKAIKEAVEADLATTEAVLRPVLGDRVHEMQTDRLTREMLLYAKRDPESLLNALDNDKLLFINAAYTAVDFRIISITDNGTVARWVGTDKSIVAIPFGRNPYEFLGEWFSTDEGLEIMNKITQKLKKK